MHVHWPAPGFIDTLLEPSGWLKAKKGHNEEKLTHGDLLTLCRELSEGHLAGGVPETTYRAHRGGAHVSMPPGCGPRPAGIACKNAPGH